MNAETAYEIWMYALVVVAIVSAVAIMRNISPKLMTAFFVPAILVLLMSWLLKQYSILGEVTFLSTVLLGTLIFVGLSTWTVSRSITWGVARAQRYVKVESRYLAVDEELFADPTQSAAYETEEHDGQHQVQGHWRYSASGTRHWVRAHTRSNPKNHTPDDTSGSSESNLKEVIEITWEPDGPPMNTFLIGWRWFWQSNREAEFSLLNEDTEFDVVIPVRGHHFFGHRITRLSHIECPTCQHEIVKWACSCGMADTFHMQDGQWYPHPPDHEV